MNGRQRFSFVFGSLLLAGSSIVSAMDTSSQGSKSRAGSPPPPAGPAAVLYDQMDSPAAIDVTSQDFEAGFDTFDAQAADDFVVPAAGWSITGVDVDGEYGSGPGPAASFNVYFYSNSGTLPGALVALRLAQPFTGTLGDAAITLTPPVVLGPGTFWIAVQAREDFGTAGQWFWGNRTPQANSPAAWVNPLGGFGFGCTTWGVRTTCVGSTGADQLFRLNGSLNVLNWTNEAPIPTDVYGSPTTAADNLVYSGGGYSFSTGSMVQNFQSWNSDTNVWTPRAALPDTLNGMGSMVYGHNGKIYLFGGEDNGAAILTAATRIYTIATNTWSAGAPMPDVRAFMGAGYFNGSIYLAGGYNTGQVTSAQTTLWRYDIATNTFNTSLAVVPAALGGSGSGVVNGVLYLAGGRDSSNTMIASLYGYDIASNTWATLTSLPSPNNVPGAGVVSGQLWVYGGGNPFLTSDEATALPTAPETTADCNRYDPVADSWSVCPALNTPVSFPGGTAVRNIPVAVGGFTGASTTTGVEANWSAPGTLPVGAGRQMVVSGETLGWGPNNYLTEAVNLAEYAFVTSRPATNAFAVFQTHDPWGATILKDAITTIGRTYSVFAPSALAGFPFASYRVVVLNWDDELLADFNSFYAAAIPALEEYVRSGGVLWLQASIQGVTGDSFGVPFGGNGHKEEHGVNVIVEPASPLMTALVSPIFGTQASHVFLDGYPAAAHLVKRAENASGGVTLYDFTPLLFVDGFETGNTTRWSVTVP